METYFIPHVSCYHPTELLALLMLFENFRSGPKPLFAYGQSETQVGLIKFSTVRQEAKHKIQSNIKNFCFKFLLCKIKSVVCIQ